jgi:hypothetical protein
MQNLSQVQKTFTFNAMSVFKKVNLKNIVRGGEQWIRFCIVHNCRCFLITLLKGYPHALNLKKPIKALGLKKVRHQNFRGMLRHCATAHMTILPLPPP